MLPGTSFPRTSSSRTRVLVGTFAAAALSVGTLTAATAPAPAADAAPRAAATTAKTVAAAEAPAAKKSAKKTAKKKRRSGKAWTRVAKETFNGPQLNSSRWSTFSGKPGCCGDTLWVGDQVQMGGGKLTLRNNPNGNGTWVSGGVGAWGWSDAVRQYGRWDARIRMDAGAGISATALLYPREGWPPEMNWFEIFETWGGRQQMQVTTHYLQNSQHKMVQRAVDGDFTKWHVFSIRWRPNRLVYKVDGKTVMVEKDPAKIPDEPMWPGFQTHVHKMNGKWPNLNGRKTVRLQVDWMKVFTATGN